MFWAPAPCLMLSPCSLCSAYQPQGWILFAHFIDKETEVQREEAPCAKSHGQARAPGGLDPETPFCPFLHMSPASCLGGEGSAQGLDGRIDFLQLAGIG